MKFDWDVAKDAANLAKHGMDFTDASTVSDDPLHYVEDATRSRYGERRAKAVGQVGPYVVAVIFTARGDRRRIISARRASRDERRTYRQGTTAS